MRITRKVLLRTFRKARRLLNKGWTKGSWARLRNGYGVVYSDPRACKFCALGAINCAAGVKADVGVTTPDEGKARLLAKKMEQLVLKTIDPSEDVSSIVLWNDRQTRKKSVLKKFDEVIASLK